MANPIFESAIPEEISSSELVKQAETLKPEFKDNAEALASAQRKLEALASEVGLSIGAFLKQAETSLHHNERFLQGLALQRQITFFKSQPK
jgi:hypothetical protein